MGIGRPSPNLTLSLHEYNSILLTTLSSTLQYAYQILKNGSFEPFFRHIWCPREELNHHLPLRTGLFYPLNYKGILLYNVVRISRLSSFTTRFLRSILHFAQRYKISCSPLAISCPTGSMSPPHVSALSPGNTSTCFDQRHSGQWFVYPFPFTSSPHCSHVKSSIFRWNWIDMLAKFKQFSES